LKSKIEELKVFKKVKLDEVEIEEVEEFKKSKIEEVKE
jgi:hypothetical protein